MTLFINTLLNRSKKRINKLYVKLEEELKYYNFLKKEYDLKHPDYPIPSEMQNLISTSLSEKKVKQTTSSDSKTSFTNSPPTSQTTQSQNTPTPVEVITEEQPTTIKPQTIIDEKKQSVIDRMKRAREIRMQNIAKKKTQPATFEQTI